MTEAEWLACDNPQRMLEVVDTASGRKLRLFAVACCQRIVTFLRSPASRQALAAAELLADGLVSLEECGSPASAVWAYYSGGGFDEDQTSDLAVFYASTFDDQTNYTRLFAHRASKGAALLGRYDRGDEALSEPQRLERVYQSRLFRDIFGNPFRPVTFDATWRTSTAVALARQMYEAREFGAMPILADALQDAGCDNEDILSHCRGEGPHVRGCWVVDLVLGKE